MTIHIRYPFTGSYQVTFPFGAVPADGEMQKKFKEWEINGHDGIDFGLPEGTEVIAVDTGIVTQSGENGDFGISITIKHAWGTSLYAHLRDVSVTIDEHVKEGTGIGHSGQTEYSIGPHLHFGIKPTGPDAANGYLGFVDPMPFFTNKGKSNTLLNNNYRNVNKLKQKRKA